MVCFTVFIEHTMHEGKLVFSQIT
ncbi:uncharacterized protein METZ01_LOCUS188344, partial [marine metagenome]